MEMGRSRLELKIEGSKYAVVALAFQQYQTIPSYVVPQNYKRRNFLAMQQEDFFTIYGIIAGKLIM